MWYGERMHVVFRTRRGAHYLAVFGRRTGAQPYVEEERRRRVHVVKVTLYGGEPGTVFRALPQMIFFTTVRMLGGGGPKRVGAVWLEVGREFMEPGRGVVVFRGLSANAFLFGELASMFSAAYALGGHRLCSYEFELG